MAAHERGTGPTMGPERRMLAALVATRYYLDDQPKAVIAREMSLSRFQVARLIEAARQSGIVTIGVDLPDGLQPESSDRLRRHLGLRHALVVSCPPDAVRRRRLLARAAAGLIGDLVTDDDVLGIAWGRTLMPLPDYLQTTATVPVVQLSGVAGTSADNSVELVRRLSQTCGGTAHPLYAPLVVADTATATGLRRQPGIADTLRRHDDVTCAVVAIGSWDPPDSQLHDALTGRERQRFSRRGARAEVSGILVDDQGGEIDGLAQRVLAITARQLARVPEVLAVAGGPSKVDAIAAVIRSGMVHGLVTDAGTADALLDGPRAGSVQE